MPSPRAVLADIKNFRLDPSKAHSNIRPNGHLAHAVQTLEVKSDESLVVVDQPVFEEVENIIVQSQPETQPEWASALALVKDDNVEEITTPTETSVSETQPEDSGHESESVTETPQPEEPATDALQTEEQEQVVSRRSRKKR